MDDNQVIKLAIIFIILTVISVMIINGFNQESIIKNDGERSSREQNRDLDNEEGHSLEYILNEEPTNSKMTLMEGENLLTSDFNLLENSLSTTYTSIILEKEMGAYDALSRITLSIGAKPTSEVNISFSSNVLTTYGCVMIGEKGDDMTFPTDYIIYDTMREEVETTFGQKDYVYAAFNATITGLLPDTEYIYIVSDGESSSYPRTFKTLDEDAIATMAFFGDIQGYTQSQYDKFREVYEKACTTAENIDLSLLAGDIVDSSNLYEEWLYLDNAVGDYLSTNLIAATPGNHDVKTGYGVYSSTFVAPNNGLLDRENRNYSFEIGNAIIGVLDTESPDTFEMQMQWLEALMADKEDCFKIVLMHRSVYPISYDEAHIRALASTFEACDIDLVLSGHDHIYSRTTMANEYTVDTGEGVTYVVGGSSSGSKYYSVKSDIDTRYWVDVVYDEKSPVFCLIDIDDTSLVFSAYGMEDDGINIIDSFKLSK